MATRFTSKKIRGMAVTLARDGVYIEPANLHDQYNVK